MKNSTVDNLVSELRAGGQVDSQGVFTLDREQARSKMRKFQLDDPLRYVAELVRCAVLRGAGRVVFEIDSNDLWMSFDGEPFTVGDFDLLYSSLFSSESDDHAQARRCLALGLNSALALEPKWIRVESGDGTTGSLLEVRGEEDRFEAVETAVDGTRIHLRRRFGSDVVGRFFRATVGRQFAEEQILRELCSLAPLEILVGEQNISSPWELDETVARVTVEENGSRLTIGLVPLLGQRRIVYLQHGVIIGSQELGSPEFLPGLRVAVDSARLQLSVSRSDVVQNERVDDVLNVVRAHQWRVVEELVRQAPGTGPDIEGLIQHQISHTGIDELTHELARAADDPTKGAHLDQPFGIECVLGRSLTIRKIHGDFLTLDSVWYSQVGFGDSPLSLEIARDDAWQRGTASMLCLRDMHSVGWFRRLYGKKLSNKTSLVRRVIARAENINRWRQRPMRPSLAAHPIAFAVRQAIRSDYVVGEVGIRRQPTDESHVELIKSGYLFSELLWQLPIPGVQAVIELDLTTNRAFDRTKRNAKLARGLLAVGESLLALFDKLRSHIGSWDEPQVSTDLFAWYAESCRGFLRWFMDPHRQRRLLESFDFNEPTIRAVLNGDAPLTASALVWSDTDDSESEHQWRELPLLETVGGSLVSLAECQEMYVSDGPVPVIDSELDLGSRPDDTQTVLRLSNQDRQLADRALPKGWRRDYSESWRYQVAEKRWLEQPPQPVLLSTDRWTAARVASRTFSHDGVSGELGLFSNVSQEREIKVGLMRKRRPIASRVFHFPGHNLVAVANYDQLVPARDFSDVEGTELAPVRRALALAARELLDWDVLKRQKGVGDLAYHARLKTIGQRDPAAHLLARNLALAIFPSIEFRRLYDALDDEQSYSSILGLLAAFNYSGVAKAVRKALKTKAVSVATVVQSVTSTNNTTFQGPAGGLAWLDVFFPLPAGVTAERYDLRVFRMLPSLAGAFQISIVAGETKTSLAELFDSLRNDRPIAFLKNSGKQELRFVQCLLGVDRVGEMSGAVGRRRKSGIERTPVKQALEFSPGEVLVSVPTGRADFPGVVGLPAVYAGGRIPRSSAILCQNGHRIGDDRWDASLALLAIIDDDELVAGTLQGSIKNDPRKMQRRDVILGRSKRLAERLAAGWESLSTSGHAAWLHVLDLLIYQLKRSPKSPFSSGPWKDLALIPGFRSAGDQRLSLLQLLQFRKQNRQLAYITEAEDSAPPLQADLIVLVLDGVEVVKLTALVGKVPNADASWWAEQKNRMRLLQSPPLPEIPADPLIKRTLSKFGLSGELFLPGRLLPEAELQVAAGFRGRKLADLDASPYLPCCAVVEVNEVRRDLETEQLELTRPQRSLLSRETVALYQQLLRRVTRGEIAEPQSRASAMDYLRLAQQSLARTGGHVGKTRKLKRALDKLFVDLADRPESKRPSTLFGKPGVPSAARKKPGVVSRPEHRLIDALRRQLRSAGEQNRSLLKGLVLDHLSFGDGSRRQVATLIGPDTMLRRKHPLVAQVARDFEADPVSLIFLSSAVYTLLNYELEEITDVDEQHFHQRLIELAISET